MKIRCLLSHALRLCSVLSLLIATAGHTQTPLINPTSDGVLPPLPQIVSISTVDAEAEEPPLFPPWTLLAVKPNTAIFKISRIGATDFDLPVHYRVEGSAKNGEDYEKLSGGTTILKGQSATLLEIVPLADALVEGSESVAIILEVPVCIDIFPPPRECYILGTSTAGKAIILDTPTGNHNLPPKVEITNPASGQSFEAPDSILVEAKTVDADGYAPYVEFFSDGAKIGDSQIVFIQAPKPGTILTHDFLWKAPSAGVHELVAIAYDDQGAASKSSAVVIKVTPVHPFAEVNIVANDPEAVEPRTPLPWEKFAINKGQFTVFRSGPTDLPLTVQLRFGGTASMGLDYEKVASGVTIPPGTNSTTIEIYPINDQIIETTETVQATIVPFDAPGLPVLGVIPVPDFSPYTIGARSTDVVKILDNGEGPLGVPEVNVVASDPEATEPPTGDPNVKIKLDDGRFTISRTGRTTDPLGVYYSIEGSATSGADFAPLPGLATIAAGSASVDVQVLPLFDRVKEGDESVVVHLIQPPYLTANILSPRVFYTVGASAAAKMVIHDNGVAVENRPPKADIVHPAGGTVFHLSDVVEIVVQTADADGYVSWVEFFAGKEKIGDSHIYFFRAPDPGTLITHSLAWHPTAVGEFGLTAVAHDDGGATTTTAIVVIKVVHNSQPTVVAIRATDAEGAEPDPVAPGMGRPTLLNPLVFEITRKGDLSVPIVVFYHLDGTAKNGHDYDLLPGRIEIPKGESSVRLMVSPIDDDLVEGDESIAVILDAPICRAVAKPQPGCYTIADGAGIAKGIIHDNDPNDSLRPTLTITAPDAIATEGKVPWASPTATFAIHRQGPTHEALTVGLKVAGTALSGKDYEALPESVVIPAGERIVKIVLKPVDDTEVEGIETVWVELLPPDTGGVKIQLGWPAYRLGRPSSAIAVILDNDQTRPPCRWLSDGHFHLCVPGIEGAKYRLETSNDLKLWTDAGPVETADGAIHYVDPSAPGQHVQFYRVVPDTDTSTP